MPSLYDAAVAALDAHHGIVGNVEETIRGLEKAIGYDADYRKAALAPAPSPAPAVDAPKAKHGKKAKKAS